MAAAAQTGGRALTLGLTSRSATDWGTYCADKAGFFTANGLAVEQVIIGSTAGSAQQLTAGSIDLGSASSTQIVEAVMGGAPIIEVLNQTTTAAYFVIARKGTTGVAQLRGKTVIVGGPSDITRVFMDKIVVANGLRPDDVIYTYAGATSDRYAALLSGGVDAAMLLPPFAFRAVADGYPVVAEVQHYIPHFPFAGLAARTAWAKSHSDLVIAFAKSYLQGVNWLFDPANRARAVQILVDVTNTKPDDAQQTYDLYVRRLQLYSRTGRYENGDFNQIFDALLKTKQISPPLPTASQIYDNRYVDAARAQLRGRRR